MNKKTNGEKFISFPPISSQECRVLILGTIASPVSLSNGFYYGHKRNQFWRILSTVLHANEPSNTQGKINLLLSAGIALWDTIRTCKRKGASDAAIKEAVPNRVIEFVQDRPCIEVVFLNGMTAGKYYRFFFADKIQLPYYILPSTIPANARIPYEKKLEKWALITTYL